MLKNIGMRELVSNGQRLNRYLNTIDDDLKKLFLAFNENTKIIQRRLERIESKLEELDSNK